MIPGDSPKGKKLLEERGLESTYVVSAKKTSRKALWIMLAVILVFMAIVCYYAYLA